MLPLAVWGACGADPPRTVSYLPSWTPFIGTKLKLGRDWKTRLHDTADATVRLTKEGLAEGNESVMSQQLATIDDQSKMIAVTMNAGGMLAVRPPSLSASWSTRD